MNSNVKIKGRDSVVLPQDGDAGIDLIAQSKTIDHKNKGIWYHTGVYLESPIHSFVFPRSSIFSKDLSLANNVAVIDSSYRGEIKLFFRYRYDDINKNTRLYDVGDKVAQLVFLSTEKPQITFTETINNDTHRNTNGFGSTGR